MTQEKSNWNIAYSYIRLFNLAMLRMQAAALRDTKAKTPRARARRSDPMEGGYRAIIHVTEGLGEMYAVKPAGPADPEDRDRAACKLAEAVGIALEDG